MSRRELAAALLRKADQDKTVFEKLRPDPDVAVDILGFHAQQAAEKLLKSALASKEIDFPYSRRLADLFDLLKESEVAFPEDLEELRFLTPFAVAFRYEIYEEEEEPFDSVRVSALLTRLREWTLGLLPAPGEADQIDTAPPSRSRGTGQRR
jgi:HEPN domain-containing protein